MKIEVGDYVEGTYPDGRRFSGTVFANYAGSGYLRVGGAFAYHDDGTPLAGVEVTLHRKPLPPEPPIGSLVESRFGSIWRRVRSSWRAVAVTDGDTGRSWEELLRDHGPLTLLERGAVVRQP